MENEVCSVWNFCKCLVQHGCHHAEHRAIRYGIADQIAAVQIENWGQVELFSEQAELRHICNPFLVRPVRMEVPIQQVWSDFADFALVRTILFRSDTANQAQFLHKPLDRLVI